MLVLFLKQWQLDMEGNISINQISTFSANFRLERKFLIPIVAVLFLGFSAAAMEDAEASHWRFGHVSWKVIDNPAGPGATVEFNGFQAWRLARCGGADPPIGNTFSQSTFRFGDTGPDSTQNGFVEIVAKNNMDPVVDERWCFAKMVGNLAGDPLVHTYTTDGPFTFEMDGCCRTGFEKNNPDRAFSVTTLIDLRSPPQPNDSPISTTSPIVPLF